MKTKIPFITIGLDLGDKKHALCVLNQEGDIIDERSITNHRESLRRLSQKYPQARIAFEVGSHSPWIKRFLADLGHEVFVANPRKLHAKCLSLCATSCNYNINPVIHARPRS